ncbi:MULTISPECIES: HAD hydrolase-like protein [Bradyrhizobium]
MPREPAARGVHINAFEYWPFHFDGPIKCYRCVSERRKPQRGMIIDLLSRLPVETSWSFLVCDRPSDVEAADAAGLPGDTFLGGNLRGFFLPLLAIG